ncbi:MAG: tetratricopeptide repeat protein, partial [Dongia sp.]
MSRFRLSSASALALAVSLLAALAACGSSPPPTMADVRKLEAQDRTFDALQTLIPMAQGGDPAAQYELAGFYHYGYVGANDYAKALKWYRASARQGYADAMVGLSVMYLGGQGVAKDPREAFVWLNLAAQYMTDKQAVAKIKRIRDSIGRGFTKDDIAFAKA